jgi:RND family efflux transporter MFP subunit
MKYTTLLLVILLTFGSCKRHVKTEKPELTQLIAQKETLLKQIDSLSSKLKKIDKDIRKLGKSKELQKVTSFITKDTIFNHYIRLQGVVASDRNVLLHPEMGGNIQRIYIKEGQRVNKGQTLIQLDASILNNKVDELKNQLNLAQTTYERQERLWKQKIGSEMQYLNAKTRKEGLEKSLQSLYTQIGKMKIKAPFSGVIDEIFSNAGELATPQAPVIRLINLNQVYIEADVPETYLKSVKKGTIVLIDFESINKQIKAKVNEVSNYINPNNRSFKIKINLSNKDHSIKPNMLADLKINDFSGKGVVLPSALIQMNQKGEHFVYTIVQDSITKVSKRLLVLDKEYNNLVLIKEGIQADEIIVNKGGKFVKDGDQVIVK